MFAPIKKMEPKPIVYEPNDTFTSIAERYLLTQGIKGYESKLKSIIMHGVWLSFVYLQENPQVLGQKIHENEELKMFTVIVEGDMSSLNRARIRYLSLLIPIHNE